MAGQIVFGLLVAIALLAGLVVFSYWVADTVIRWIDKRIANPVPPLSDHSVWKGNGA